MRIKQSAKNSSLQQESAYLKQIIKIQSLLGQANFNLDAFMQLVAEQLQLLTPATGTVIELVEENEMVYQAATGILANHVGLRLNKQGSISGLCVAKKEVLYSEDTKQDERVNSEACKRFGIRSLVVAPLIYESKSIGVLKILSDKPQAFSIKDRHILQLMAGFIASGLAHQILCEANEHILKERTKALKQLHEAQEKSSYLAHHDYLTQLLNRKSFDEILQRSMAHVKRHGCLLGLMYLDIDYFKSINDTYGHVIGDKLLKAFSARIKRSIRESDTFARLGGDEFIILLEELTAEQDAIVIANKLIKKVSDPFKFNDLTLVLTTSIGIAFYRGEEDSATKLLADADYALYQVKQAGRNNVKIYKSSD
ncbi:sensory box/GGDEF family protein [Legionella busanensis]|uniref:Sensory box/GGDEF family protein n=1 Tax=Legionella busanensis TaxID=190655 RepID=A0A378JIH7_9GAMM|nr:sensor domain-containing diguanylate cyclase [Legionella busanensis]STX50050.1 sensory box/GGDEF family protein [Legionella busanensis]